MRIARLVAALLAAAACGTTVSTTGSLPGTDTPVPVQNGEGNVDGAPGAPIGGTGGLPTDGSTSNQGTGGQVTVGTPNTPGGTGGTRQIGATRTIKIGWEIEEDADTTRAAFGLEDTSSPANYEDVAKVLTRWINANGGMGGHRVEVFIHYTNANNGTWELQGQAACSAFAEDQKVFAVLSSVNRSESLPHCLAKHRIPFFLSRPERFSPLKEFDRIAEYYYLPLTLNYHRAAVIVDELIRQGLFTKQSKIGLLTIDHPVFRPFLDEIVKPRLKALGYTVADTQYIYAPPGVSGLGQSSADISSAVLRFRANGVDRVLFANTAGVGPVFFMPEAESQAYHPQYGISSYEYPTSFVQLAPQEQLVNTRGIGWSTVSDLLEPEWPANPSRAHCRALLRKAGVGNATGNECDALLLIDAALDRSRDATPAGLRRGVESLGRSYASSILAGSVFAPGRRHDGAGAYRTLTYDSRCGCFTYTGPLRLLP